MEKEKTLSLPNRHEASAGATDAAASPVADARNWRTGLPILCGALATLRELRPDDAASLLTAMACDEVSRFISPPPATLAGFERFIAWQHRARTAGLSLCFAMVPRGSASAVGVFQLRSLDLDFGVSEWGVALDVEYWGTGMFAEAAELVFGFAFDVVGVHRLEARSALKNGRGNSALRKIGAVQESLLRRSFVKNGEYLDQALWTILREEWMEAKAVWSSQLVH